MPSRRTRRAGRSTHVNLALATLERCIEEKDLPSIQQCVDNGVDVNAATPVSGLTPLELALTERNTSMMQVLLNAGANTEQRNNQGTTILTTAIRDGYLDGVKLLVQYGANVNACSENRKSCLLFALEKKHHLIAAYLLEQDSCQVDLYGTESPCLLQLLVLANDAALISSLKNRGVSLNTRCPDGTVALFFAIKHCKNKALEGLLEAGTDPNTGTEIGDFPLHEAVRRSNAKAVKNLMAHGADSSIVDKGGVTPIHVAIEKTCLPLLRVLLDYGAGIEHRCIHGSTPLLAACSLGDMEAVELLVEQGADVNSHGVDMMTCLDVAREKEHHSVVAYLLQQGAHQGILFERDGSIRSQNLVLAEEVALIPRLKLRGLDLNARYSDGTVLVFFATKHCKNEALKALLDSGANPNIATEDGDFALHEAVRQNNMDAVKHLMEHGADTQILSKNGLTPLDVAINKQCVPMLGLLLDCGANIEQYCAQGSTPLLAACSIGYTEGVQLLVERGANLKARSVNGMTSLLIALEKGYQSIADYLMNQGSYEVNEIARDGFGALHRAVILNHNEVVHRLIRMQADINIQTHDGEVPVFLAAKYGKVDLLRMLLEAGAVPNVDTKDGDFALHEAVKHSDVEAVELLLQHGADRDRLDKRGMTPLEVAMALVPPPQDIIHCLLTAHVGDQGSEVSNSLGRPAGNNRKISVADLEEALCCCPITFEIMKDPVIAMDGHTYEREAIEEWIREKRESPVTRQPLTSATLIPNLAIKHLIDQLANVDSNA